MLIPLFFDNHVVVVRYPGVFTKCCKRLCKWYNYCKYVSAGSSAFDETSFCDKILFSVDCTDYFFQYTIKNSCLLFRISCQQIAFRHG